MPKKAYHFIRLISLVLFMVLASYFEVSAVVTKGMNRHEVHTTVVRAMADLELKAILEPVIEIGSVNNSGRAISGIKKEGGICFYELSSIKENALLMGESIFYDIHHIPLYISFRSILI